MEAAFLEIYTLVFVIITGACFGSFFNVVIYRLPAGKSVVKPRSQCACGAMIPWYDNIPVLSWFVLRGKCRQCRRGFSIRYPLVEALTAGIFGGIWWVYPPGAALGYLLFVSLLIPAAFIDLDTMEIPDRFSIGGFLLGVVLAFAYPAMHGMDSGLWVADSLRGLIFSLQGAFVGSGLILWIAVIAEIVFRKEAMGFGDVKLMGAIGAFCGWQGAVFALFGGAVLGTLSLAVCLPAIRRRASKNQDTEPGLRMPFGPALVGGAILYLLIMRSWVSEYFASIHAILY